MSPSDSVSKKPGRNVKAEIIKKVIKLEKQVWKAAQKRNAKLFQELVPADAIMIFQSGVTGQPEYVRTMNSRTISHYELGVMRGFMPTVGTVILYYEAIRVGEEADVLFPRGGVLESTTWVKRKGRWVAVLNQETPLASKSTLPKLRNQHKSHS
jgi:hypothetical protein